MTGRKKSNFPGITTIPSDATLDFVSSGVNYKITLSDFLAALNVTGSIVQDGDPTSTPVLGTQGTVNNIRNLKNGPGVKSSVNAQNGITLEHNFIQDPDGFALMHNPTAERPTLVSLVEGDGIDLSLDGAALTLSVSGLAAASQVVPINALSDFPNAVSGVITLEPNSAYLLTNSVSTSSRFVLQDGTALISYSPTIATLTYTGTGTMLTAVDARAVLGGASFSCPSGQFLDISETGAGNTKIFTVANCEVQECASLGTLNNLFGANVTNSSALDCDQGLTFAGTGWSLISLNEFGMISTNAAFVGVDLTGVISDGIEIANPFMAAPAGGIAVKGDAASANITAGNLGTLTGGNFPGSITPESGITVATAVRWRSLNNDGLPDTRPDGLLSMQGNATVTVISASSTDGSNAVLIAGAWDVGEVSHMAGTVAGRLTSTGERDVRFPVTASVSVEPASGTNVTISVYMVVDGVVDTDSRRTGTASSGSPTSVTLPWQLTFSEGTYAEVYVENNDNSTDILVSSGILRVN